MSSLLPENEQQMRQAVYRALADPLSLPREFKDYLGRYLELDQPSFRLSQIQGWRGYVGANNSASCSAQTEVPAESDSDPIAIPGCELEIYQPGLYQLSGVFEFSRDTGTGEEFQEHSPTQASNLGGAGQDWVNPTNALAVDGSVTTNTPGAATGDSLATFTYAFDVPTNATVNKLEVLTRVADDGAGGGHHLLHQLMSFGTPMGNTESIIIADGAAMTTHTVLDDVSDTWGATLTPAAVNSSGFGVFITPSWPGASSQSQIDWVGMRVYADDIWVQANGYLYLGEVAQDVTAVLPASAIAKGSRYTTSVIWIVEIIEACTATLRVGKAYEGGEVFVETGTTLGVVRIS